ncbi:unnamed protein product [Schistosoma turkestanicum]|nr:unnamed protein product [Schistosoma turkestanicum]
MSCTLDTKCFAVQMKLTLLDENFLYYSISAKTKAGKILNDVVTHLKITHPQYFGIKVQDRMHNWKNILYQMKSLDSPPLIEQSIKQTSNRQDPQCIPLRNVIPTESQPISSLTEKFISSFRTCGLKACSSTSRPESTHTYVKNVHKPLTLIYQAYLGIKFYPPDPTIIADEQTRYQVFIQVRNDLISGRMQVDENLFVTLCGLILQSDCGDYGADRLGSNYVKHLLKLPNLNEQLEKRIKAKHEDCRCRQPALVEYQLLDKVKQLPTYGQIKFHIKETISNTPCLLCLGPVGVIIEDSRKNLIQFSWSQITGFNHKHKQILIKILNEGTRFTYRCSVDNSETCNTLLETCKNYLNFYKNEVSQKILNEPNQSMVNTKNVCSTSTSQPIVYPNSSLDKNESAFIGNEPNLLPESNYSVQMTNSVQPVVNVDEADHCKSIRNTRPLYSSLIEFNPGYTVKSPVPSNTMIDSKFTTDSCDFHHCPHHHRQHYVTESNYHHYYPPNAIPINPYHVHGTSGVFYRPRGCETVTDIGDHPRVYANRRSQCSNYNPSRLIIDDSIDCKFIKHRRRSFPKTKHYFIEKEDFDENHLVQKQCSSFYPTLHNDSCQSPQYISSSPVVKSSAYREFHQLDKLIPTTTSSFRLSSSHGRCAGGRVPKRSHRILPRPISRLDRYAERCASPATTDHDVDVDDDDDSQVTIENYENHNVNHRHAMNNNNNVNSHNNHTNNTNLSGKSIINTEDPCKTNSAIVASVAQSSNLNNKPNRNKLHTETCELVIQTRSNEQTVHDNHCCHSPRGNSSRIVNRKIPISSSSSIMKSTLHSNSCKMNDGKSNHQSNSLWYYPSHHTNNHDDGVVVSRHHQDPKLSNFSRTQVGDGGDDEEGEDEDDETEGNNNKLTINNHNDAGVADEENDNDDEDNSKGLTDLENGLFHHTHQYTNKPVVNSTPTSTTSTTTDTTSFCSSFIYCADESETPSLLKNSDVNSDFGGTSLLMEEFHLPPTPNSNYYNNQERMTVNERVDESNSDSNLPSPPSNDFLYQLRKYKLDNEQQLLESNLENGNHALTTVDTTTTTNTGFSSRNENKRGRKLPLLPCERSILKPIDSDKSLIVSKTATLTSSPRSKITTTMRTESMKINRPIVTSLLSPTPSPRMFKTLVDHQKQLPACSSDPKQGINKTEITLHPEVVSECDLV